MESVTPSTSFWIFFLGLLFQILSWPILFLAGAKPHGEAPFVIDILGTAWFFIPLVSILGIAAGVYSRRKSGPRFSAFVGILLNTGWLCLFLLCCYFVFGVGVQV